jgi:hypothetical protein
MKIIIELHNRFRYIEEAHLYLVNKTIRCEIVNKYINHTFIFVHNLIKDVIYRKNHYTY